MYKYVLIDYFATGEGRTIFALITRAYPCYDENKNLIEDPDKCALMEMKKKIGEADGGIEWYSRASELLTKGEFIQRMGDLIPSPVLNQIEENKKPEDVPGNFVWFSEYISILAKEEKR